MNFATHKSLHQLDLILDDKEDKPITNVHRGLMLLDHCFTHAKIRTTRNPPKTEEITYRKLKNIDSRKLSRDIIEILSRTKTRSVSQLVDYYNTSMKSVLDKHAPEKQRSSGKATTNPGLMTLLSRK